MAVAGSFVQAMASGKAGVGVEPNGVVAEMDSFGFEVAEQPGAKPGSPPRGIDPHAFDFAGRGGDSLDAPATNGQAVAACDDEDRSFIVRRRSVGRTRGRGIESVGKSTVQLGEVLVDCLRSQRRSRIDPA